eukprot:Nitzschia sp. Nitz4//scaffold53_size117307//3324//4850//NITZ4_003751-RA/size117307-augustus-gene-0.96-mRNA-1//-1//CDS//3329554148//6255//frame0
MTYDFRDASFSFQACFYIPFIVAPLSCASSCYVVYLLLRMEHRAELKKSVRDQLLLGMSVLDILASFGLSFSTLPGPEEGVNTEIRYEYPRFGNVQTCEAQAFFVHMGAGVPWYNAAICIYYVLSIRYNVPDRKILKWLVPIAHATILLWTLSSAMLGLTMEMFNFAGFLGCWIGKAGSLCEANEIYCDRGATSDKFQQIIVVIPMALALFVVMVCMTIVYFTVRRIEANSRRWDFSRSTRTAHNSHEVSMSVRSTGTRSEDLDASSGVSPQRRPLSLTRRTMRTCLLYGGAFLLVYLPIGISSFIPADANARVRGMIRVLSTFFFPLQGFFNLLIFTAKTWVPVAKERWHSTIQVCFKGNAVSSAEISDDRTPPGNGRVHRLGDTTIQSIGSTNTKEVRFIDLPGSEPATEQAKELLPTKPIKPVDGTAGEKTDSAPSQETHKEADVTGGDSPPTNHPVYSLDIALREKASESSLLE